MIQGIDQVESKLNLGAFGDGRILEQRQVNVVHVLCADVREPEREGTMFLCQSVGRRGRVEPGDIKPATDVVYLETCVLIERLLALRDGNITAKEDCIVGEVQWRANLPGVDARPANR